MGMIAEKTVLRRLMARLLCMLVVLALAAPCGRAAALSDHRMPAMTMSCCSGGQVVAAPMLCCSLHPQPAELTSAHNFDAAMPAATRQFKSVLFPRPALIADAAAPVPPLRLPTTNLRI